jgi:hypothetical protein
MRNILHDAAVVCQDYLLILFSDELNWNKEQVFEIPARKTEVIRKISTPLPLFSS